MDTKRLQALLLDPACDGLGDIHIIARKPFWDEEALPFQVAGGGSVLRLVPDKGFSKRLLAGTDDELRTITDCHDAPGWLVPSGTVAGWMARQVDNEQLDDLLLSHPLYGYLTQPDDAGHSRGGRVRLVHWAPAMPHLATIAAPEFLPDDAEAPAVNRLRSKYADAVVDLLDRLEASFDVAEIEVGARFERPHRRPAARRIRRK